MCQVQIKDSEKCHTKIVHKSRALLVRLSRMSVKTQFVQTCDSQVWSFQEEGGCQGMLLSEIRTRYPNIAWISSFGFLPRNGSLWVYQLSGCCQSWHQASGVHLLAVQRRGARSCLDGKSDGHTTHLRECSFLCFRTYQDSRLFKFKDSFFVLFTLCLYKCYRSYLGLYGKGMCQLDVVLVVFIFPDSR